MSPRAASRLRGAHCYVCGFLSAYFQLVDLCNFGSLRCTTMEDALRNSMFSLKSGRAGLGGRKMVRPPICVSPHRACISVLLVLASAGLARAGPAKAPAEPPETIVAIGDVHGDLANFEAILQETDLMNARHQWTGRGIVLVQTGDVVDRGPSSRQCLDLLMALERQADRQQGKVIALLGNHEVMAMTGDLRYVSAEDYQGFSTDKSEKVRERAYQDYLDFMSSQSDRVRAESAAEAKSRESWMMEHPLGYFERRDAFGPQGVYGRWLREHNAVVQLKDGVFVHGGLSPNISFRDISELNQQIRSDIASFDALWQSLSKKKIIWRYMTISEAILQAESEWAAIQAQPQVDAELKEELRKFLTVPKLFINSPDSPLWYRGLALESGQMPASSDVEAMLARLKIGYLVIAHTPTPDGRIHPRFGNHVFLIDTGMLRAVFGGRASALEINDGRFTAYYVNEKSQALPAPAKVANSSLVPNEVLSGPQP